MDNITHSLAGAAFAELVVRIRGPRAGDPPALRGALWLTSIFASNAPDLDIVLSPAIRSPLGYMLHHRGHTHTVLLAPVLAALAVGAAWLWARKRGGLPRPAQGLAFALATAMVLLHSAMDFGNSYGVHPFWPFESRWHYGDSIFILEPLIWAVLAIPLAFAVETKAARYTLAAIPALGLVLSATFPMVTYLGLALVALVTALMWLAMRNAGLVARPLTAVLALFAVEAMFFAVHVEAEIHARGAAAAAFPRATTVDVVMSPSPANPLCWSSLVLAIDGDDFVSRRIGISLAGEIQDVEDCRFTAPDETTAPRVTIERTSTESVLFFDETRTPLAVLRDLAEHSEDAMALFRWSRAPYAVAHDDRMIAGDIRFDREAALGFGEIETHRDTPLDGWVPTWTPPRIDVLDPAQRPAARVHDIVTE